MIEELSTLGTMNTTTTPISPVELVGKYLDVDSKALSQYLKTNFINNFFDKKPGVFTQHSVGLCSIQFRDLTVWFVVNDVELLKNIPKNLSTLVIFYKVNCVHEVETLLYLGVDKVVFTRPPTEEVIKSMTSEKVYSMFRYLHKIHKEDSDVEIEPLPAENNAFREIPIESITHINSIQSSGMPLADLLHYLQDSSGGAWDGVSIHKMVVTSSNRNSNMLRGITIWVQASYNSKKLTFGIPYTFSKEPSVTIQLCLTPEERTQVACSLPVPNDNHFRDVLKAFHPNSGTPIAISFSKWSKPFFDKAYSAFAERYRMSTGRSLTSEAPSTKKFVLRADTFSELSTPNN
jgi:hypothetical protein